MRYIVAMLALAIGLALTLWETAAEPQKLPRQDVPSVVCHWADSPITLDGQVTEDAWKSAPEITSFGQPWLKVEDRAKLPRTAARLLWDHEALYFFAEMDDDSLSAKTTEHDGETWKDDTFELFFQPDRTKPGYYEFEVNARNTQFDAFFPKWDLAKLGNQAKIGTFHMKTHVHLRGTLDKTGPADRGWSVEGRIPWTDFLRTGGRPQAGETWGISLCRVDARKESTTQTLSTISPITERRLPAFFHQVEDFARVTFQGPKPLTQVPNALPKRVDVDSRVIGRPEPPPPYRVVRVREGLAPRYPIMARLIPGTQEMLLITQPASYGPTTLSRVPVGAKTSEIVKLMDTPDGGTAYDLAFPPDFAQSGFVYIGWNGPGKGTKKSKFSRITRYTFDAKRQTLDPQSGKTIIQWESDGHNGAALCFGKDGMLYVTSGDGTSDSDTDLMGQRPDTLLAKVLRIDVNGVSPGKQYRVPADNPYVDDARFAPETWAYGLRNPWRITSDPVSGQIWVGNNGQDLWEQAYLVRKGENYGWSVQEGGHPFAPTRSTGPTPIVKPTVEHHHSEFRSLTGGIVYRGQRHKDLVGAYIYGDHSTGSIWGIRHDGTKILWHKELAESTLKITGFTVDADGELLILHHAPEGQGGFFTLEPSPVVREANPFPRTLSASGLFTEVARHEMKPGVVPYSVNAPFWSDGLHKQRWIAIPGTERIEYRRTRGWNFPERTVIIKSFALEQIEGDPKSRKWIETRFLTKQQGEWRGYSYIWNDTGTDATLVSSRGMDQEYEVKTRTGVRKQTWHFPSRAECMVCHSRAANFVLGLCTVQMNRQEHDQNQMVALDQAGYLQVDWPGELRQFVVEQGRSQGLAGKALDDFVREHLPQPGQRTASPEVIADLLPKLVNPSEARHDLTARAKSWLHSNCASCHIEAGGGNAQMDLEYTTPLEKMRILNVKPIHQALSLPEGLLVMPGQPEKSLLLRRAEIRGAHQMPPIGSNRVDPLGSELLREWIKQLK